MIPFKPKQFNDTQVINVLSAWQTMPVVLYDIMRRFRLNNRLALEFGVENGYSLSALANYFHKVIGVDPFDFNPQQDVITTYKQVQERLKDYKNVALFVGTAEEYIKQTLLKRYDLIHIDIGYESHDYTTTYPVGERAVQHSRCVLFHDIFTFPEINTVCEELAAKYNMKYHAYTEEVGPVGVPCGLGILTRMRW